MKQNKYKAYENKSQEQTEADVIKRGLLLFWNCRICVKLGWHIENNCKLSKDTCSTFLYNRLKKHFFENCNDEIERIVVGRMSSQLLMDLNK